MGGRSGNGLKNAENNVERENNSSNRYGKDFEERFGSYDIDRIYERARRH